MIQKLWVINNDSSFSGWILHRVWLVLRTNLLWTTMVRKITKSYNQWQGRDAPKRWWYCFLGPSGMFLVNTFSVVWVISFISHFIVLSSFRKTNIRLHLPVNGVSKKTNKKCRNLHILIVVKENCKIFKIQSKRFWKKIEIFTRIRYHQYLACSIWQIRSSHLPFFPTLSKSYPYLPRRNDWLLYRFGFI